MRHALLALLVLLTLSACGFQPLYGEGMRPAELQLADVKIENIEDRAGQQLRLLLSDRFYSAHGQSPSPRYSLTVHFTTAKQELGIRRDDVATRARLALIGTFALHDTMGNSPDFNGSERSFVSYNILLDPYATSEAEDNATNRGITQLADNITSRIALYLAGQASAQAAMRSSSDAGAGIKSPVVVPPSPAAMPRIVGRDTQ